MKTKRVDTLVNNDVILEPDLLRRGRFSKYKVTAAHVAACSPYKTHVIVDGNRTWCYDSGFEVTIQ